MVCKEWFKQGHVLFLALFLGLSSFLYLQMAPGMGGHPETSRVIFKRIDRGGPAGKMAGLSPKGLSDSDKEVSPTKTQGSQEITPSVTDQGGIMGGTTAGKAVPEIQGKGKVIGNRDSKLYHLPGMKYYDRVRAYHRIEFDSEEDAVHAGYRKAKE